MALRWRQSEFSLKLLQEKGFFQRLGEILHFSFGELLLKRDKIFFDDETLTRAVGKALFLYPEPLPEREALKEEALKILKSASLSRDWRVLKNLLKKSKALYREVEGYFAGEDKVLRPDFILIQEGEVYLLEFKLRKEDLQEEQLELYQRFLESLFPQRKIRLCLLTFIPFQLKFFEKQEEGLSHEAPKLLYTTQLSLFEEFN